MALDVLSFTAGTIIGGDTPPVPPVPTDFTILNQDGTMGADGYVYGTLDTSLDINVGDKYKVAVLNSNDNIWFETNVYVEAGTDIYDGYNVINFIKYLPTTDTSVVSSKTYYGLFAGRYTVIQSPTTAGLSTYFEKTVFVTVVNNGSFNYSTTPISVSPSDTASWRWKVELSYRQTIVCNRVENTENPAVKYGDTIIDDWETIIANANRKSTGNDSIAFYNLGDTKTIEFNYNTTEISRDCSIPMAVQLEVVGKNHDNLSPVTIVNQNGTVGIDDYVYGTTDLSSRFCVGDVYHFTLYSGGSEIISDNAIVSAGNGIYEGYNILDYQGDFIIVDHGSFNYSTEPISVSPSETSSWRWRVDLSDEYTVVVTKITNNNKAALTFMVRWRQINERYNTASASGTTPGTGNNGGWAAYDGDIYEASLNETNGTLVYGCNIRKSLWGVYKSFNQSLIDGVKTVDKKYDDNSTTIRTVKDKIFLPSIEELGISTYTYGGNEMILTGQGTQYEKFIDANSRRKAGIGNPTYGTRSRMRRPDSNAYAIALNTSNGGATNASTTSYIPVCFCFCL